MKIQVLNEAFTPTVYIDVSAMAKVQQYVQQCEKEIGWMGQIRTEKSASDSPILTLHNPYAPAQEISGATCDLDEGMGEGTFLEYAMGLGVDATTVRWWGHSHVNMGVSPSGTDMKTFLEHVETDYDTPFVMTIHNKKGSIYSNVYLGGGLYMEDATIYVDYGAAECKDVVKAELKQNLREKTYYAKPVTAINSYPGLPTDFGDNSNHWRGGDRVESSKSASKKRNAKSNAVGLRPSGKSQRTKSSVRKQSGGRKQSKSNAKTN